MPELVLDDQPVIEIAGTLSPDPLPASLPAGSIVTLDLELTLRNSNTPFTFSTKASFLSPRGFSGGIGFRNVSSKEVVTYIDIHAFVVGGPDIDPERDLLELLPNVAVPYKLESEVFTLKASSGQEQPHIFGTRLSSMWPGETYKMVCNVGSRRRIAWFNWASLEDTKRDQFPAYDAKDRSKHIFATQLLPYNDLVIPQLRMQSDIKFTMKE